MNIGYKSTGYLSGAVRAPAIHMAKSLWQSLLMLGVLFLLAFSNTSAAQQVVSQYEGQVEEYASVKARGKFLSTKWVVEVDFGQAFELSIKNKDILRDADGSAIKFNSPIDAVNYMNAQGWTLISANSEPEYFFAILRRPYQAPNQDK